MGYLRVDIQTNELMPLFRDELNEFVKVTPLVANVRTSDDGALAPLKIKLPLASRCLNKA